MVVAFGALHAHAQKYLTEPFADVLGLATVAKDHRRPVAMRVALRGDDLANHSIVGLILAKAVAQPLIEHVDALDADA